MFLRYLKNFCTGLLWLAVLLPTAAVTGFLLVWALDNGGIAPAQGVPLAAAILAVAGLCGFFWLKPGPPQLEAVRPGRVNLTATFSTWGLPAKQFVAKVWAQSPRFGLPRLDFLQRSSVPNPVAPTSITRESVGVHSVIWFTPPVTVPQAIVRKETALYASQK